MKKFLMAICALAVATTVASAAIGVSWSTGTWGYAHDGVAAVLDNNSALWQLIYAGTDNMIDPIPANSTVGLTDAYGDDAVWAYRTIAQGGGTAPEDSTVWDNWLQPVSGSTMYTDMSWTTAGFVYQRVFESAAPVPGTYYYESGLTALITTYDAGSPASVTISFADNGSGFIPSQQIAAVPEPATMGLLGLGALVMAIRRRRA